MCFLVSFLPGGTIMGVKFTALFIVVFLFAASGAHAQTAGVVSLRANSTSAQGSMAPVLTWSTNPTATSCRASGGWSGDKAVYGTQTLPTITASTNYTLTCTWGTGSTVVAWAAPTANTDGSTLVNLASFRIYHGTSSTSLTRNLPVTDVTARSARVDGLTPGTWYFSVRAVNTQGIESANSNIGSKAVTGATAANSVAITITSTTTPVRKTIATPVYDLTRDASGKWILGRYVGTIAIGRYCRSYHLSGDYWGVQTGAVTFTRAMRGNTLVAHCALAN
jgi:hypothetical protein